MDFSNKYKNKIENSKKKSNSKFNRTLRIYQCKIKHIKIMSERKDPIEARMAEVFFGFRGQGHSGFFLQLRKCDSHHLNRTLDF